MLCVVLDWVGIVDDVMLYMYDSGMSKLTDAGVGFIASAGCGVNFSSLSLDGNCFGSVLLLVLWDYCCTMRL